jgi:hypothetical protein
VTTTYAGSLTLSQCVPGAASANAQASASVNASLGDVQARVDGMLSIQASLTINPPDLAALAAQLQVMITSLLTAPPVVPQLTAVAAALAELQVTLAELNANLAASVSLGLQLASPGIHYYVFAGRADAIGPELQALLSAGLPGGSGPSQSIAGAVLLANDAGAIAALQAVLRS